MLSSGPAKKVTIYVMEGEQYHGSALYSAILEFLFFRGISDATVTRGIAGFGAEHKLHTTRLLELADKMPIKVEFIESAQTVDELMPKLYDMVGTGLIEVQDTTVVKPARVTKPAPVPGRKIEGRAKLMRVYLSERDRWGNKPLYQALVEALRANDIAGVTVQAGIMGYGPNRRLYQERVVTFSHDRPILLTVIDAEEKLQGFFPLLDTMVTDGLVLISDVDVVRYTHDYERAERRQEARP